jgi:hypothetical protein
MKRELTYLSHRQHKSADRVEKERWKEVALKVKAMKKRKTQWEIVKLERPIAGVKKCKYERQCKGNLRGRTESA